MRLASLFPRYFLSASRHKERRREIHFIWAEPGSRLPADSRRLIGSSLFAFCLFVGSCSASFLRCFYIFSGSLFFLAGMVGGGRAEGGCVRAPHPNKDQTHLLAVSCPDTQCCTNMCSCQWLPNDVDLFKFHIHIVAQRAARLQTGSRVHTPARARASNNRNDTDLFICDDACRQCLSVQREVAGGADGGFFLFALSKRLPTACIHTHTHTHRLPLVKTAE